MGCAHAERNDLAPGTLVTPRVRLVEPLGRGGMADVWIAEHLGLGTRVAVKLVCAELLDNRIILERFRREARAAARIRHAHVVQLFDHGLMRDGTPFIVMELLSGETLGRRLDRIGGMPLHDVAELVAQVADGLTAVHELGIVHRDIKPDNLFLCEARSTPLVKILDFGVAAFKGGGGLPKLTRQGVVLGTPHYLSPERIYGGARSECADDLWALAVVAYEALTGLLPFDGESIEQVLRRIRRGAFVKPSLLVDVGVEIDEWFARALHPDPAARFATAGELALALAERMPVSVRTRTVDVPLHQRELGRMPTAPIATRRRRVEAARAVVLVLCAALGAFASWHLSCARTPAPRAPALSPGLTGPAEIGAVRREPLRQKPVPSAHRF